MRISDWSSDVCSSDLHHRAEHRRRRRAGVPRVETIRQEHTMCASSPESRAWRAPPTKVPRRSAHNHASSTPTLSPPRCFDYSCVHLLTSVLFLATRLKPAVFKIDRTGDSEGQGVEKRVDRG